MTDQHYSRQIITPVRSLRDPAGPHTQSVGSPLDTGGIGNTGDHDAGELYSDQFIDGNALAGPLHEIFAVDLTAAVSRCASCGLTGAVASLRVYTRAPGLVARCPGCQQVVLRLVRGPACAWLDLRGAVSIQIPLPPAGDGTSDLPAG